MARPTKYPKIAAYFDQLRKEKGFPTTRKIASEIGFSHAAVSEAWSGRTLPNRRLAEAMLYALEGDWDEFGPLYAEARREQVAVEVKPLTPDPMVMAINNLAEAIRELARTPRR